MPNNMQEQQLVQESWYDFPYHYLTGIPPKFGVARFYDWHLNYASAIDFLLEKIGNDKKRASVVDIGCGDGRLTSELAQRFPDARVAGIDYSERAIGLAKALNARSNIEFVACDLIADPRKDTFDIAVLMEVYEHIEPAKGEAFLHSVKDLMAADGVLHLTVPHVNMPTDPHHFRHFDAATIRAELEKFFTVEEVIPFEKISKKRRWLNRILANKIFILNHDSLLNCVFKYYKSNLFYCSSEAQCQRLYVRAVRRSDT